MNLVHRLGFLVDGPGSVKGHPTVRRPGRAGLDETAARALRRATAALTGVGGCAVGR